MRISSSRFSFLTISATIISIITSFIFSLITWIVIMIIRLILWKFSYLTINWDFIRIYYIIWYTLKSLWWIIYFLKILSLLIHLLIIFIIIIWYAQVLTHKVMIGILWPLSIIIVSTFCKLSCGLCIWSLIFIIIKLLIWPQMRH